MRTGIDCLCVLLASLACAPIVHAQPAPGPTQETILDGTEQSLLIVGYSTSYAWPAMLQQMLDEHAGGKRRYHVLNAVAGGAAVEIWIDKPGSRNHERTMGAMKRDFFGKAPRLRGKAPAPRTALAQQSLQFTRTRRGPIAKADDADGIRIGADALERLAWQLKDLGIRRTYYGMHVYKKPVEPEVGNERLALAVLLERSHPFIFAGPDVWKPTREGFPGCFEKDGVHPNELGMKIMAEGWYRTLAGATSKQDVIDRMRARPYDVRPMMMAYLRWRREGGDVPGVILRKDG